MVVSNYSSMEDLDAANDAHSSIFADIGQYITGQPLIRSGEIVGRVDGNTPVSDMGYMRFVRLSIDDSKWDAIQSYMDGNLASAFDGVAGLSRLRVARLREGSSEGKPAMLAAAAYDNEANAQAAMGAARAGDGLPGRSLLPPRPPGAGRGGGGVPESSKMLKNK